MPLPPGGESPPPRPVPARGPTTRSASPDGPPVLRAQFLPPAATAPSAGRPGAARPVPQSASGLCPATDRIPQDCEQVACEFLASLVTPAGDFGMRGLLRIEEALDIGPNQMMLAAQPARGDEVLHQ